jgi:hypothetical protein
MPNTPVLRIIRSSTAGALLTLGSLALSPAQDMPKPQWVLVTISKVKPDMRLQYEGYQKELSAAYKKANVPFRVVYQNVLGDLAEYSSVYPIPDFGSMEGDSPTVRALGKDQAAELTRKGSQYLMDLRRTALVMRPDLSVLEKAPRLLPYAVISRVTLAAGKQHNYDQWVQNELNPAMKMGGVTQIFTYQTIFGGGPDYVSIAPIDKLAFIDAGHPAWKMEGGRAAAEKMFARTAGVVTSADSNIVRLRPDLGYFPGPPAPSSK